MKTVFLYASSHGRTRKVVELLLPQLKIKPDVFNVKDSPPLEQLSGYDIFLFFSPTYGDEELQTDMEAFILQFSLDLTGKCFAVCELGNYHGYDSYTLGAMPILRHYLFKLGGTELCQPLSLDSLPRVNWKHLNRWGEHVNDALNRQYCPLLP